MAKSLYSVIFAISVASLEAFAQLAAATPQGPKSSITMEMTGGAGWLKDDVAKKQKVDDAFATVGLQFDYAHKEFLSLGLGVEGWLLDDEGEFTQLVSTRFGETDPDKAFLADSEVSALSLHAEVGMRRAILSQLVAGLDVGYAQTAEVTREIPNCVNCDVQDLKLDAGPYLKPHLTLGTGLFFAQLGYRHYLGGDVESDIRGALGLRLPLK